MINKIHKPWKHKFSNLSHLQILGVTRVTCSKFHTQNPQISRAIAQNFVTLVTQCPGFVPTGIYLLTYLLTYSMVQSPS